MQVLLTGAFGNLGLFTARALLARGFHVTTFDVGSPRTHKLAAGLGSRERVQASWGDIRDPAAVRRVVQAARPDAVVHLAAVIPPPAYFDAALARAVNVDGTANLLAAAAGLASAPRFVLASSYTVHGSRNGARELPLLTVTTPVAPADAYAGHKVEAELLVRRGGLPWVILRIGTCLPVQPSRADPRTLRMSFELPRRSRSHCVDQRDVATAFANAVDADAIGKVLFIGGDASHRTRQGEMVQAYHRALGLAPFLDEAFAVPDPELDAAWYFEEWMDTAEAQALLRFQRYTLADYIAAVGRANQVQALLLRPFGRLARQQLCKHSPYLGRPPAIHSTPIVDRLVALFGESVRPHPASLAAAAALNGEIVR